MASSDIPSLLLPILLYFASIPPSENQREVMVLVNSSSGSVTFIEGSLNLDTLLSNKEGPLPASKESIDSMQVVEVVEGEVLECAICLSEFKVGGEAKEMPCKHRYHLDCVDKWLMINGSCQICRCKMPVDEEKVKDVGVESGDDSGRGEPIGFHVFIGRDRDLYSDLDTNSSLNSGPNEQRESEEVSIRDGEELTGIQDMDMSAAAR